MQEQKATADNVRTYLLGLQASITQALEAVEKAAGAGAATSGVAAAGAGAATSGATCAEVTTGVDTTSVGMGFEQAHNVAAAINESVFMGGL